MLHHVCFIVTIEHAGVKLHLQNACHSNWIHTACSEYTYYSLFRGYVQSYVLQLVQLVNSTQYKPAPFQPAQENPHPQIFCYPERH